MGIPKQQERGACRECSKTQELDIYCLGLNPSKYALTYPTK